MSCPICHGRGLYEQATGFGKMDVVCRCQRLQEETEQQHQCRMNLYYAIKALENIQSIDLGFTPEGSDYACQFHDRLFEFEQFVRELDREYQLQLESK